MRKVVGTVLRITGRGVPTCRIWRAFSAWARAAALATAAARRTRVRLRWPSQFNLARPSGQIPLSLSPLGLCPQGRTPHVITKERR